MRIGFSPRLLVGISLSLVSTIRISAQAEVTMLVPGFTVRELPLKLTNVNNLRFTPDGKLSALGYDGRVHLLTDSDGDGLEDKDTLFWDRTTMSVPVGMVWSKEGLYVSSHGKVSLLRDTDGDGKADVEDIVASGWPATDVASGGVDATAVTLDGAGNLYFGLLTANYANPYRVKDGVSRYDLSSPRGTIQKRSATTQQLETIATGIRVPYTLAFNRLGDLFVTDQEGATWCPDGNPLDELNHIVLGRNYGFPPRNEKYLPHLLSEPPVIGFGPQHQSACGFVFNEPTAAQKRFGPADWENDAFVAGESRGKIWRARLLKTAAGYVGQEMTIARLSLLTMDVAISPSGDLYVTCHTGNPDWGTGPRGAGKIFKISHTDATAPQPAAIWVSAPQEVTVAFDRPIDPSVAAEVAEMKIEFGEFVSTADRYEKLKPPYQTVKDQESAARGKLRVVAARLSADHRSLVLTTDPHPQSVRYAVTLPGIKADGAAKATATATVDLGYDLNGVEATWTAAAGAATWRGWLPHLDSQVNAAFTTGSVAHAQLAERLRENGILQLRAQIWIAAALGKPTVRVQASRAFEISIGGQNTAARSVSPEVFVAEIGLETSAGSAGRATVVALDFPTGGGAALTYTASYSTDLDPTVRPLMLSAFLLPWAPPRSVVAPVEREKTDIAGGDYERGRALFFGKTLACVGCHQVRGEGATVGPDLSNLAYRDAASVLRDIKDPSATINPDYVAYTVKLRDGSGLVGFVRAQDEATLRIVGVDGNEQTVARANIAEMQPSPVSLMPPGLIDGLKDGQVRDLLTFLVNAPPVRTQVEVAAVRRAGGTSSTAKAATPKPLRLVLVASKQDHGAGQHDYPTWQKSWSALLARAPGVTVTYAWEWPSAEQWDNADVILFNFRHKIWTAENYRQLDAFQQRGGGLVVLHAGTIVDQEPEKLALRIGLAAQPGPTKYLHTSVTLKFAPPAEDGIARGFKTMRILDEPYWPMFGDVAKVRVLATGEVEAQSRPLVWTFQNGKGRVFGSIPGHYTWTLDDPLVRLLVLRGLAWSCGEATGRFDGLE
jgi:putative heme-binding domain-containing protein